MNFSDDDQSDAPHSSSKAAEEVMQAEFDFTTPDGANSPPMSQAGRKKRHHLPKGAKL
jgi:hypothetical protein